jgi:hypothetical protein
MAFFFPFCLPYFLFTLLSLTPVSPVCVLTAASLSYISLFPPPAISFLAFLWQFYTEKLSSTDGSALFNTT